MCLNTTWPTLTSARACTLAVSYSVIRTYLFQDNIRVCHFIARFKCRFALLFSYRTLSMLFCFNRWLFDKAGLLLNRPAQGGQSAIIRPHCKGTDEKYTVYALKCNHPKIWISTLVGCSFSLVLFLFVTWNNKNKQTNKNIAKSDQVLGEVCWPILTSSASTLYFSRSTCQYFLAPPLGVMMCRIFWGICSTIKTKALHQSPSNNFNYNFQLD